jgi:hypothetical protein
LAIFSKMPFSFDFSSLLTASSPLLHSSILFRISSLLFHFFFFLFFILLISAFFSSQHIRHEGVEAVQRRWKPAAWVTVGVGLGGARRRWLGSDRW